MRKTHSRFRQLILEPSRLAKISSSGTLPVSSFLRLRWNLLRQFGLRYQLCAAFIREFYRRRFCRRSFRRLFIN
jgi:hypothetical protein